MAKKLTALLLLVLMLAGTISCASDDGERAAVTTASNSAETTAPVEEDTRVYPDIPTEDINYNGEDFRFLHWYHSAWEHRRNKDIYSESENGGEINDAVYKRNFKIQETYGIKIALQEEDLGQIAGIVKKNVQNGEHVHDVVYGRMVDLASTITDGNFLDLHMLSYIDFEKPWWDQRSVESLSVDGKLFLVATDLNIIDKDATAAIAFNKEQAESKQLENLYEVVNGGRWTVDYLMGTFKDVTEDLDGSQTMDEEDFWAFLGKSDVLMSFYTGGGGTFCEKDDEDLPVFSFGQEKNVNIASKMFELVFDKDNFYNQHTSALKDDDLAFEALFPNGHGLFYWMRLDCVTQMRSADTEFGIIPIPKYNEAQEDYLSYVSPHTSGLLTVPITAGGSQDLLDKIGLILEALSAESKYTLMPAYYETALKTKGARDDDSAEMLDIIFANRTFDVGDIFGFGSFSANFQTLANGSNSDIASFVTRNEKATNKAIERFIDKIASIG